MLFHVPLTRRQVRTAFATMVLLGLVASSASSPTVRTVGLTALGAAAGLALIDHTTTNRQLPPAAA